MKRPQIRQFAKFAGTVLLTVAMHVSAQYVSLGPTDPNFCANVEQIKPNLHLQREVQLKGRVLDQTGAPLEQSRVELRVYISKDVQRPFATATTDHQGEFVFKEVPKGEYRLLPSPTRAFAQPDDLRCGTGAQCFLKITLKANKTDMPDTQCPIR